MTAPTEPRPPGSGHPLAHDPVAVYNRIAPAFDRLVEPRRLYLDSIDGLIISRVPAASRSLLDVGAGDGCRALRIAQTRNLTDLVLLEPSLEMQRLGSTPEAYRRLRAEQLQELSGRFDVILCLWNVLGHVFPHTARVEVLRQFARLASPPGRIFVDVHHRYNAAHYGAVATSVRFLRDRIRPSETNGDVTVTWNIEGRAHSLPGHVFTHREMSALARAAGLTIQRRFVVDYATGRQRRFAVQGHLLYELSVRVPG